jgi:hypothetical protein
MAASAAYPRPTRERARSVLAARLLYFCTALSFTREPNNSVASHVGPGLLASPPSGHVCASILLLFCGWKVRGAVLRMSTSVWCARCHACDSGRYAGTATRSGLCHHPRAGSRVRTASRTSYCSPPPRLVCDFPHGCYASAPQTAWQHNCTCCLVPPCASVYRAWYRALYRLEPPFEPPFVPGFVPQCRGLLSVASDLASPSIAWERGLQRKRAAASWH